MHTYVVHLGCSATDRSPLQDDNKGQVRLKRMAWVKPFWEPVPQEDRLDLLSIPLSELKQGAAEAGAKQRKEQGGQVASQCHLPGLLGLQWDSSLDKLKQQAAQVGASR